MGLGWKELLIILVIVLLVFGTKRLTNIGNDLGKAIQGFKKGVSDGNNPSETGSDSTANTHSAKSATNLGDDLGDDRPRNNND